MNSRKRQKRKIKFLNRFELHQLQNQRKTIESLETIFGQNIQLTKAKLIADEHLAIVKNNNLEVFNLEPIIRTIQNILREVDFSTIN